MWFFWSLSWIAIFLAFIFASLCVASGLYYLAELVEEYATTSARVIRTMIFITIGVYIGFLLFEDLPLTMILCGISGQISHLYMMRTFPYFVLNSISFVSTIFFIILNHYFAFSHFHAHLYTFAEVISYFTICLWIVPFAFFVSLSANDFVLPTQAESRPLLGDENDVVSNYFSKKGKKYGLLGFLNNMKEGLLPQRSKKF